MDDLAFKKCVRLCNNIIMAFSCPRGQVEMVARLVAAAAYTGEIGDGKVMANLGCAAQAAF